MPKAALEWHGSTLLRRTVGIMARVTSGPVVVVRATGQDLPELPEGTLVVDDPREGKGPVQGIAAGLAALMAASALTRFGVFEAGRASARDPKYTVGPQRQRLREPGEPAI